jgi:KipI family sensor histidine kinase inhibitor
VSPRPAGPGDGVRLLPVGADALLAELPSGGHVEALHAEVLRRRAAGTLPAVDEVVPAARTLLFDGVADPARLAAELAAWTPTAHPPAGDGPLVEIPVRYDGPDLAEVAALWGTTPAGAAELHAAAEHRVAFCGFAPGFGYLTGLPEPYDAVPRRATPRTRVPAGAVALAGPWTGIYPRPSPGGWQLVGRTDVELFDPARDPAALLAPGTRVRFVPVDGPAGGREAP